MTQQKGEHVRTKRRRNIASMLRSSPRCSEHHTSKRRSGSVHEHAVNVPMSTPFACMVIRRRSTRGRLRAGSQRQVEEVLVRANWSGWVEGRRRFLQENYMQACVLSNSVSIIRIIIPRCHEHFNRSTERSGTARTTAGCSMIRLCFVSGTSDPGSIGDTFEREDLLRSVE
jgi:hypothetical protein